MFDQNGLSLDQAPPIWVVLRLFLTGSVFGIFAGFSVLYYQSDILNPSTTGAVIFTHLMALGVMLSFMLGALFQMLPVIAGVVLTNPIRRSSLVQYPFVLGVTTLVLGFMTDMQWLFVLASVLLGGAILYVSITMIAKLSKLPNHSASSRGILASLITLMITIILALYLAGTFGGILSGELFVQIKNIHYSFGLFGWITLLIISISFQTIEMFYVTPVYPKVMSQFLPPSVILLLSVLSIAYFVGLASYARFIEVGLASVFIYYGLITLLRLSQRKRPLADATMWFWRIGMSSLIFSMLLLISNSFLSSKALLEIEMILFGSFALSVLFAMFYKIVPFLTWFHLNSQGYFTAPMMHEVIHPKSAKKHLWIHIATICSFLLAVVFPSILMLSGVLTMLSFGWVGYLVWHAYRLYKHTQETGEKFDMSMMS